MTVVPNFVCASTPITEITIPNSVKEIGLWAFQNCTFLNKITILDNVIDMGNSSSDTDLVFENHNDSLTVYCYKDSMAANYAIKYNIKYVYLTKPVSDTPGTTGESSNNKGESTGSTATKGTDTTLKTGTLPYTGVGIGVTVAIGLVIVGGLFTYIRYFKLRDI